MKLHPIFQKVTGVFIQQTKTSERISTKQWWDQISVRLKMTRQIQRHFWRSSRHLALKTIFFSTCIFRW
ncbi:hypothetical protein ScPMuIL_013052 [Solemya velum]